MYLCNLTLKRANSDRKKERKEGRLDGEIYTIDYSELPVETQNYVETNDYLDQNKEINLPCLNVEFTAPQMLRLQDVEG